MAAPASATLVHAFAHLGTLGRALLGRNRAIAVGVSAGKHPVRHGQKLGLIDGTVIIGISHPCHPLGAITPASAMHAAATVVAATFTFGSVGAISAPCRHALAHLCSLRVPFGTADRPVTIAVHAGKAFGMRIFAGRRPILTGQTAVAVGVGTGKARLCSRARLGTRDLTVIIAVRVGARGILTMRRNHHCCGNGEDGG